MFGEENKLFQPLDFPPPSHPLRSYFRNLFSRQRQNKLQKVEAFQVCKQFSTKSLHQAPLLTLPAKDSPLIWKVPLEPLRRFVYNS